MNGLFYGICLLFVIGSAMADCDIGKVTKCQEKYGPKMQKQDDKDAMCKAVAGMVSCMEAAASGCGEQVEKILDQSREMLKNAGCPESSNVPKLYAHSSVISGAFLAAVALKKLLL